MILVMINPPPVCLSSMPFVGPRYLLAKNILGIFSQKDFSTFESLIKTKAYKRPDSSNANGLLPLRHAKTQTPYFWNIHKIKYGHMPFLLEKTTQNVILMNLVPSGKGTILGKSTTLTDMYSHRHSRDSTVCVIRLILPTQLFLDRMHVREQQHVTLFVFVDHCGRN